MVKSGTYLANPGFTVGVPNVDVVGADGTKPELQLTGTAAGQGIVFGAGASGGKLRHLKLEAPGGAVAVSALAPVAVSDVDVNARGPGIATSPGVPGASTIRRSRISVASPFGGETGLRLDAGTVVSDTLVRADSPAAQPGGSAIASAGDSRFRNVTAIASGTGSRALLVRAVNSTRVVSVKNSILRGDSAANDLVVQMGAPAVFPPNSIQCTLAFDPAVCVDTQTSNLTIDHSNFRAATGPLNAASGSNQTADPQFTNAAGGDFRPKAGSPAIDAGINDPDNGPTDLDGLARSVGLAPDIGAYEFVPPPPAEQPTTPGGNTEPGPQPGVTTPVADQTAPALTALGITNKKFAVGAKATAVTARAKKGTTFVFSLSEQARTTLTIQRGRPGRRKGRSCTKPTSKNRKAKKCTRYVKVGALARNGVSGANAVPFSGRIGKKALKPATYRAAIAAVDGADNRSATKYVAFRVVRR